MSNVVLHPAYAKKLQEKFPHKEIILSTIAIIAIIGISVVISII